MKSIFKKYLLRNVLLSVFFLMMVAPTVYGLFDAMEFMEDAGIDAQETVQGEDAHEAVHEEAKDDAAFPGEPTMESIEKESSSTPSSTPSSSESTPDSSSTSSSKTVVAPEGSTILPDKGILTTADCESVMRYVNYTPIDEIREKIAKKSREIGVIVYHADGSSTTYNLHYNSILGCAITTGDIKAWMVPFFIRYILEFIIGLAGLIAVGGIVYGGYLYLFAGLSDDKDKGKNTIKNGIIGFVIVLTSWAIVNIVISLVTL